MWHESDNISVLVADSSYVTNRAIRVVFVGEQDLIVPPQAVERLSVTGEVALVVVDRELEHLAQAALVGEW